MKIKEFRAGMSIDAAYKFLCEASQECGQPTVGEFNGKVLASDMTLDECYMKVTGKTKAEFDAETKRQVEEYERKEREHKEHIPAIVEKYKEEAKGLIKEEEWDYFLKVLPIRVGDLYHGIEIQNMLEIINVLKENKDDERKALDAAGKVFDEQGHSGMSAGLVAQLVRKFSPWFGNEFFEKIYR